MIEHEAQRAGRRVLAREVVVVEVREHWVMDPADIDDGDLRIGELLRRWLAPDHGAVMDCGEHTDGEQVVFVRATGMRDDRVHGGPCTLPSVRDRPSYGCA
ncbi:MAG: hypothetical protein WKG01_17840 [Kofleriaceae bacterium]